MGDYIEFAKYLIEELYNTPDGNVGGYGHIVFDDYNLDDGFIKGCIDDAVLGDSTWIGEETRTASINALSFFLLLSEEQREEALGIKDNDD